MGLTTNIKIMILCIIVSVNLTLFGEDLNSKLIDAVKAGNTNEVRTLLEQGADVNVKIFDDYYKGWAVLKVAAKLGNTDIERLLIDKGADLNIKDNNDYSALMLAVNFSHTEIAKILLDKGADVNSKNSYGGTALMGAVGNAEKDNTEIVKLLIDKGAYVNAKTDFEGKTALMKAAEEGQTEIAKLLIEKGADVNARIMDGTTIKGWTALIYATRWGHLETVKLLIEKGADLNATNEEGWNALRAAIPVNNNLTDIAKLLIEKGADINARISSNNATALMCFAKEGSSEIVKLLIDKGADVNAKTKDGSTALKMAALYGHTGIVKLLIDNGADVNAKGEMGTTPLMLAASGGYNEILKLLIDRSDELYASLIAAVDSENIAGIELLISKGLETKKIGTIEIFLAQLRAESKIYPNAEIINFLGMKISGNSFNFAEFEGTYYVGLGINLIDVKTLLTDNKYQDMALYFLNNKSLFVGTITYVLGSWLKEHGQLPKLSGEISKYLDYDVSQAQNGFDFIMQKD